MHETSVPPRNEDVRWNALISESEATIEQYLVPKIDMDLAPFVRCITFRVFLVVFLGVDSGTLAFPDIQLVTRALSDFYDDVGGRNTLPPDVQRILYGWLPRKQFRSSLDRILPAYEALWRIIAMAVLSCEDDETKALRWVMLDFRDNPRDRQYSASLGGDGRCVSAIMDGVADRIASVARPPPQNATTSTWPLSCIQYASASNLGAEYAPTRREALKFAALLASKVIGRIGVHYGISGDGNVPGSQAVPWERRKIFGVNRSSGHHTIDIVDVRPPAGSSRQVY